MQKDDVIYRQAAIDEIKNYCKNGCDIAEDNWCPSCQREQFVELLKVLPSAQPEQMEGEWVPVHPLQSDDPGAYMCSKCKTGMWEIRPSSYHYCPHCGARMTISTK